MADNNSFGTVTTCRENPRQVREFVNYHLNLGTALMVIYFDDPADPAMDQFENEPRVLCRACNDAHWYALLGRLPTSTAEALTRNIEEGASILKGRGISWIMSIDADELLHSSAPMTELLASVGPAVDVVVARPMEAIQHEGMPRALKFRSRFFREFTPTLTTAQEQASIRHMKGVHEFGEAGCFGHLEGKSFFRASAEIDKYGSHMPRNSKKQLRKIVREDIALLHFEAINFESWQRRWLRRFAGDTVFPGMSDRRWTQHHHIKQSYDEGGRAGMQRLFRRWHVYSPTAVAALRRARLVREIPIPSSRFTRPVKGVRHARG